MEAGHKKEDGQGQNGRGLAHQNFERMVCFQYGKTSALQIPNLADWNFPMPRFIPMKVEL